MAAEVTEQDLHSITDTLSCSFPLKKIILFGSQATGEADDKSDVDLLVITDFKGNRRQLMTEMNRLLDESARQPVDLLILTPEEYEKELQIPGTLARYAGRYGRIVYERPS